MEPVVGLTFVVACMASIISAIAGGGGGLIISPYMLLIGLPPQIAAATPKLAGIGLALGSLKKFKQAKLLNYETIKLLLPIAFISGIVGPQIVTKTPPETIRIIIIVATIAISTFSFFSNNIGLKQKPTTGYRSALGAFLYLVTTTLQSAFSSGIGTFNMFIFMGVFGMPALSANATKRFLGLAGLIPGFVSFALLGLINWPHGLALLLGMFVGGQLGAHIAVKKGNAFVRDSFLVITILTAATVLLRG